MKKVLLVFDGYFFRCIGKWFRGNWGAPLSYAGLERLVLSEMALRLPSAKGGFAVTKRWYYEGVNPGSPWTNALIRRLNANQIRPCLSPLRRGSEKGVDCQIALDIGTYILSPSRPDVIVLVAGDGDLTPLVQRCRNINVDVVVVGLNAELPNQKRIGVASTLRSRATLWIDLAQVTSRLELDLIRPLLVPGKRKARTGVRHGRTGASASASCGALASQSQ